MFRVLVILLTVGLLLILGGAGYFFFTGQPPALPGTYKPNYESSTESQTTNVKGNNNSGATSPTVEESEKEADESLMMLDSDTTSLDQGMQQDPIDLTP